MIRFAIYSRTGPKTLHPQDIYKDRDLGRGEGFAAQIGGEIVAEYFDMGVPGNVPWEKRPQAAALLQHMADLRRGFDAVVIPHSMRALGRSACRAMSFFVRAGIPVWLPDLGDRFQPDIEEHRIYLYIINGFTTCGGGRCQDRRGTALCLLDEEYPA